MKTNKHIRSSEKQFGATFFIFFMLLTGLFFHKKNDLYQLTLSIATLFLLITIFRPSFLTHLNNFWTKLGIITEKLMSPILLFVIFFGLFMPIKFFLKLFKKDLIKIKNDNLKQTYWLNNQSDCFDFTKQF